MKQQYLNIIQFGINVFDIDKSLPPMEVANLAIKKLEEFFFETCKLDSNFKAINIDEQYFDIMAAKHVIMMYYMALSH